VLKLLLRHPCSQNQLEKVLGSPPEKIMALLSALEKQGLISKEPNDCWALTDYSQNR